MSGKTDGQRAYDAWWATAEGVPTPPDVTYEEDREAWEAAAAAGAAPAHERAAELLAELNAVRAERDRYRKALGEAADRYLVDVGEPVPAMTGAGTEHVAAELAEREGRR